MGTCVWKQVTNTQYPDHYHNSRFIITKEFEEFILDQLEDPWYKIDFTGSSSLLSSGVTLLLFPSSASERQVFLATWKDIPNENELQYQIKECHLNAGRSPYIYE